MTPAPPTIEQTGGKPLLAATLAAEPLRGPHAALPLMAQSTRASVRDRMPAYAMCGWYRENDKDHSQYKRTIDDTLGMGYRAFKVKVGRYDLDDDVERIEVGFKTAGKGIRIMVDANQAYNRVEAIRRGRAYQQLGCFWYEEPLVPYDHEGYAEVAAALDMRVATGSRLNNASIRHRGSSFGFVTINQNRSVRSKGSSRGLRDQHTVVDNFIGVVDRSRRSN